jgi:coenzyme Q-binding protein COQ10
MPRHHEVRQLPYSAAQMFAMVADVARYAEFLPWVAATRVRADNESEMLADVIVGFKGLREQFTSRVIKERPGRIDVDYVDGPLKHLNNAWRFTDRPDGGCEVDFTVDFSFRNGIFERLAGQVFDRALRAMTNAFVERADALYGTGSGNSSSSATATA